MPSAPQQSKLVNWPSAYIDIPLPDGEAIGLDRGYRLADVRATADRPVNTVERANWPPSQMYDTTVSGMIFLVPSSTPASWIFHQQFDGLMKSDELREGWAMLRCPARRGGGRGRSWDDGLPDVVESTRLLISGSSTFVPKSPGRFSKNAALRFGRSS
jgi:hypothetical protein